MAFLIVAALLLALLLPVAARAELPKPWVELGVDGSLSVRQIVAKGAACASVEADGKAVAMTRRGRADEAFPVDVCEASAPGTVAKLSLGGKALPVVPAAIKRIVVFGDTGCRIEGKSAQSCNDPKEWPYATVAARAAARKPDLVIHVGDYYYRETACPAAQAGCANSPHGDNFPVWQAEFFDPAAPLLDAAPWLMVRGNHELCRRGGRGWFRLLEPRPTPDGCADTTAPYRIAPGGLSLAVFDSADSDDFKTDPAKVSVFAAEMAELLAGAPAHSWLVTHRPVWALAQGNLPGVPMNLTNQAAIKGHVPETLDMVVSGHLHDFTSYDFGGGHPSQLIAGTGGDTLLPAAAAPLVGAEIDGVKVQKGMILAKFGYFVMDRAGDGWTGTFYSPDDSVLVTCRIAGRALDCR
ncbi:MAG TPA: metallophosphoesterase [Stellaceae bacterium]|nr:metallophosphoesterase [Stellaceae bacterium]